MKPTDLQNKIVEAKGNIVVNASAGTGKTFTLVSKIAKDLEVNEDHRCIAAITFTIKAADEIKNRLPFEVGYSFIGTNNSFVFHEIIEPFLTDIYPAFKFKDIVVNYGIRFDSYYNGLDKLIKDGIIGTYSNIKRNFIFEMGLEILKKSESCRLFIQSKYFKIYIDEYQDTDNEMHKLFMYLCDELNIELFVVGDQKQSIYTWRGADPKYFKSIHLKGNFSTFDLFENFRSTAAINNYCNLLNKETNHLFTEIKDTSDVIFAKISNKNPWKFVIDLIDVNKSFCLLRFTKNDASTAAINLTENGFKTIYVPKPPVFDITTSDQWFYINIAKFIKDDFYSVHNFVKEIPGFINNDDYYTIEISNYLNQISKATNKEKFSNKINELTNYLDYPINSHNTDKLWETISTDDYNSALIDEEISSRTLTFHSSKGLEFDQVVLFTSDYPLRKDESIYNHYVASTRAKEKLIILVEDNATCYINNIKKMMDVIGKTSKDFGVWK